MLDRDSESFDAARFWIPVVAGVFFCILVGRLVVEEASVWFLVICLSLGAAALTFYEPKLGLGLIVFSMLLSPRLRGASVGQSGAMGSNIEIRLDDILLVIVIVAWFGRTAILKGESFLIRTPLHFPMFLYTFVCVLSTGLAMMRGDLPVLRPMFFILKYFEYFMLYFMTVNVIQTREDIRRYLFAGWIVAVIVTLFGYAQIPSGERITTPFETPLSVGSEAKIQRANEANTYGGYCLVVFGVLLAHFTQGGANDALLGILTFIFMMAPFFLTLSRASYIGLTMMVVFLLSASLRKRWQLATGLVFVFTVMFMIPRIRQSVVNRVLYTFTGEAVTMQGGLSDEEIEAIQKGKLEDSAKARVDSWKRIVRVHFPRHPILGSGVTAVGLVDVQMPRVLGEMGLVGLGIFLWMLWRVGKLGWDVFSSSEEPRDRALGLGLLAALVGLVFHSFGANTFIIVRVVEPFWFLAALCARLDYNRRLESAEIAE